MRPLSQAVDFKYPGRMKTSVNHPLANSDEGNPAWCRAAPQRAGRVGRGAPCQGASECREPRVSMRWESERTDLPPICIEMRSLRVADRLFEPFEVASNCLFARVKGVGPTPWTRTDPMDNGFKGEEEHYHEVAACGELPFRVSRPRL
jgi:hypothetical protein